MQTTTTVRSRGAIALGAFFATVTAYVLFDDVVHGAPISTTHVLALAALVAAIASGHMAWPALRSGAILPGAMLVVLFLASTGYVVVSSGARNAAETANRSAAIEAANGIRERELANLAKAEAMHAEASANLARECRTGNGTRCKGVQRTVAVYEAAIRGHNVTLAGLPAPRTATGYAHTARVLRSWGLNVTDEWLSLNMPFVIVLICELGTIAFLHLGFGHARKPEPEWRDEDVAPLPVAEDDKVLSFCRAFKAANGRAPTIPEVQSKFPDCPKTTAWRRAKTA